MRSASKSHPRLQPPTLESVQTAFSQWRKQKKLTEKIPNQLWELVRQLIGRYKISKIMTHLSINTSQLKRAGLTSQSSETKNDAKPFVNVELSSILPGKDYTSTSPTIHQQQLILERKDGKRLIVNNPSKDQTAVILKQFLG
jgi:hypothetical protein